MAVAVDIRGDCRTKQPSPNTSPRPKMARTAFLPFLDATVSFTVPLRT